MTPGDAAPRALRVTTLNILHDAVRSPSAAWPLRRPLVAELLRSADPDVACLQEVSARQLDDLAHDLGSYEVVAGPASGPTRLPGWASGLEAFARWRLGEFLDAGEHCPVLVRRSVFAGIESQSFRLPGENSTPHLVHRVRWRRTAGLPPGAIYNVHLGLVPGRARSTATELLSRLDRDWDGTPQILAGDFNAHPGGTLIRVLLAPRAGPIPPLRDAWLEARERTGPGRSFHWGLGLPGPRLDYVLVRPPHPVVRAATSMVRRGRVFASDHRAVTADVDLLSGG